MTNNINQVKVTYSDAELRNLVEEYITQQKSEFTLKGLCSYILFWAMEEGKIAEGKILIDSYELQSGDQKRIHCILEAITHDGRIANTTDGSYKKFN